MTFKNSPLLVAPGLVATVLLSPQAVATSPPPTPVTELVMYGIDADTHEFLRYSFETDTFMRIAVIVDQNGYVIDHPQSMTYYPVGPDAGFYCSPMGKDDTGGPTNVLAKIDVLTGKAYMYSTPLTYTDLRGLTTAYDPVAGEWTMYAIAHNNQVPKLVKINPATGEDTLVMDLPPSPGGSGWEGLSLHPSPNMFYAITSHKLFEINLLTSSVTEIGDHTVWARTEALEIAFGDDSNAIAIPGVPPGWTNDGALFCFSDTEDQMLIYHPASGSFELYPCSFETVDCEGLVLFTKQQDPYRGILADVFD